MNASRGSACEALLAEQKAAQADVESQPLLKPGKYSLPAHAAAPPPPVLADGQPYAYDTDSGFSTNLCECCTGPQACQICLLSWLLPCFAHGIIADDASDGKSSQKLPCMLYTFGWLLSLFVNSPGVLLVVLGTLTRGKLRNKYGLHSDGCADCCTHFWCHPCAMAQEIRHIRDTRTAMVTAPGPGGIANVAPESVEKMQLVSWTPVRQRDQVACLSSAYI